MLKDFTPRLYQETILSTCAQKNTLVILPTGMGKTGIALLLAVQRLKFYPQSKILLLTPTKPLAEQHLQTFKSHLEVDEQKIVLFTGEVPPAKRAELWKNAQIIFSTPQCVSGNAQIFSLDKGPTDIKSFVESFDLKPRKYGNKEGYSCDVNCQILGFRDGRIKPVIISKVWRLPSPVLQEFKFELGDTLCCTQEHPLLSLNSSGDITWIQAKDLKKGDFVARADAIDLPYKRTNIFALINKHNFNIADKSLIKHCLDKIKQHPAFKGKLSQYSRFKHNRLPLTTYFYLANKLNINKKCIVITNRTSRSEKLKLHRFITPDLAYIIGAMLGDGHIGDRGSKHGSEVVYSELSYNSIKKVFIDKMKVVFDILPSSDDKNKGLMYYSTALSNILSDLGVKKGDKSHDIRVPMYLFDETREIVAQFIAGVFNSDGDAHKHMIRIATVSKKFAEDLKWLLLKLRISSYIEKRKTPISEIKKRTIPSSEIFIVIISGRTNLEKFLIYCTPAQDKCKKLLQSLKETKKPHTRSKQIIPVQDLLKKCYLNHRQQGGAASIDLRLAYHHKNLSKTNLSRIIPQLMDSPDLNKLKKLIDLPIRWVRIKNKKDSKNNDFVYDITVNETHNFICNFIINHNTVENDVINSSVNLAEVSLIVFDEAHRAVGDYSYVFLAKQYDRKAQYPRILALTASPGSELQTIQDVCKNLHIEEVEIRTHKDPDVQQYIQPIDITTTKIELPEDFRTIIRLLQQSIKTKTEEIKKYGITEEINTKSKKDLLLFQARLQAEIAKGTTGFEILKTISLLAEIMKTQHALELIESQGITVLQKYFEKIFSEAQAGKTKAVQNLAKDLHFRTAALKTQKLFEQKIEHPKLAEVKKIVQEEINKNKYVKILLFTQFRDSAVKVCEEISKIPNVVPGVFVGQAKKGDTGLSQKKQIEMLQQFKDGFFNVLIATSVAEEGLDIPSVELVLFYEPIPSAIRSIQRRGRTGRQDKGKVIVLVAKGTRDEAYNWSSKRKEQKMQYFMTQLKSTLKQNFVKTYPTLNTFIPVEKKVKIFADYREKGSNTIKKLLDSNVDLKLEMLNCADYILSERVGVELKKTRDFVSSLIDGRLLQQLKMLKQNYYRPLIIIEGEENIYSMRNVHPNAIRGMLATIAVSYGIPILQTKNEDETAMMLLSIAKREQDEGTKEFSPHADKKPLTAAQQQEYIVASLPSVGPALAKELLKQFKTVKNVVNASNEELQKIEGVGEKISKRIKELIETEYKANP